MNLHLDIEEHIKDSLKYIEKRLINQSVRRALVSIAGPVKKKIKARTPRNSGQLVRAIGHSAEINRKLSAAVVYVGLAKKHTSRGLITRGLAQEYGNIHTSPQPFLKPAANLSAQQVQKDFGTFFEQHLDHLVEQSP